MTTKDFWKNFPKPIIGLAPMEGYSDTAFRRVCKWVNPDIVTFTGIDINMGCPAKKVVQSEHGVALRKNHPLAFRFSKTALAKRDAKPSFQ